MNEKELSEAIREGLNRSRGDFLKDITLSLLWIIGGVIVGFILMAYVIAPIWNNYENKKCIENPETCEAPISPVAISSCPFEEISCRIIVGNETDEFVDRFLRGCGYQEVNALFEQLKPRIKEEYNNSVDVKYLECD